MQLSTKDQIYNSEGQLNYFTLGKNFQCYAPFKGTFYDTYTCNSSLAHS